MTSQRIDQEWLVSWAIAVLLSMSAWLLGRLLLWLIGPEADVIVSYGLAIGTFTIVAVLFNLSDKPSSRFNGIEDQYLGPLFLAPVLMIPISHYLAVIAFVSKFLLGLLVLAVLIILIVAFFTGQWSIAAVSFVVLIIAGLGADVLLPGNSESPAPRVTATDTETTRCDGLRGYIDTTIPNDHVLIGKSVETVNSIIATNPAIQESFARSLLLTGKLFQVEQGVDVCVLNMTADSFIVKLRILEGTRKGQSGYLPFEYMVYY